MQSHPLRTLLALSVVSLVGLITPLLLDGPPVVACLGSAILPLVVACRPSLIAFLRVREDEAGAQRGLPERRLL